MGTPRFARQASFPPQKVFMTPGGTLWKIQVREWSFALVDAHDVDTDLEVGSNDPTVSPGFFDRSEQRITFTREFLADNFSSNGSVKLFAKSEGFTFVNFFRPSSSFDAVGDRLQVQVLRRDATTEKQISLTRLNGKTVAVNAPDAIAYEMDTTVSLSEATNLLDVFAKVPSGANHVAISSHAGTPKDRGLPDQTLGLYITGFHHNARIAIGNCEAVFGTLKGKMADNCIIWIGGCEIGLNDAFCKAAAKASGCPLVAAAKAVTLTKFPKFYVDLVDRYANPVVFMPDGSKPFIRDLCAKQEKLNFVVPV
jgi:hypothetical protein